MTFDVTKRLDAQRIAAIELLKEKLASLDRVNASCESEIAKLRALIAEQRAAHKTQLHQQSIKHDDSVHQLQHKLSENVVVTTNQHNELKRLHDVVDAKCVENGELRQQAESLSNQNIRLRGLLADVRFVSAQEIQSLHAQICALETLHDE